MQFLQQKPQTQLHFVQLWRYYVYDNITAFNWKQAKFESTRRYLYKYTPTFGYGAIIIQTHEIKIQIKKKGYTRTSN